MRIFHVTTINLFFIFEIIFIALQRNKYNKLTPKVLKALNEKKLNYHIAFGTFLFFFRDKNFRDQDIDIAVYSQDYKDPNKVQKIIESIGFHLREKWLWKGEVAEMSFRNNKNFKLDVFFLDKDDPRERAWDEANGRYSRKTIIYKYKIKKYKYKDLHFYGPSEPEKYLDWEYGYWEKPDPTYHWFLGGKNSNKKEFKDIEYLESFKY